MSTRRTIDFAHQGMAARVAVTASEWNILEEVEFSGDLELVDMAGSYMIAPERFDLIYSDRTKRSVVFPIIELEGLLGMLEHYFEVTEVAPPMPDLKIELNGPDGELLAWSWYSIGGFPTANEYRAKFQEVFARLAGNDSRAYRLVLVTAMDGDAEAARERLSGFMMEHGTALNAGLSGATGASQ